MSWVAFPRLSSSPGAAQVFVGDFGVSAARNPSFMLDGNPVQPVALRPMTSVRGPTYVSPLNARAFTGLYEFQNLPPARFATLRVALGGESRLLPLSAPPAEIPEDAQGGFDVLLTSCFCAAEYKRDNLRSALAAMLSGVRAKPTVGRRPDCTFLMGDQVYLDLPTLADFHSDGPWLAGKFENDYVANWSDKLAPVLGIAPSVALPDDHEFWNNAPHASPFVGNSATQAGRDVWRAAAQTMLEAFVRPRPDAAPRPGDTPFVLTVPPVSFFLGDGRSSRQADLTQTFTAACRTALAQWVQMLNDQGLVGVFATGQSLFRDPVSQLGGKFADYELPNYGDYAAIVETLRRARRPLLCLTGDVHWGRVVAARDRSNAVRTQEVIVSPLSLVTTVGADQVSSVVGFIGGLFGKRDPWPRHSDAGPPPASFGTGADRYSCQTVAKIKGDQLALLSFAFNKAARRLKVWVTYYSIHDQPPPPVRVPLLDIPLSN